MQAGCAVAVEADGVDGEGDDVEDAVNSGISGKVRGEKEGNRTTQHPPARRPSSVSRPE